jgi:hypothetical protein
MIEVGEMSEFRMNYDEAVMYCFCLGDGWRIPTEYEFFEVASICNSWYVGRLTYYNTANRKPTWYVTPVRDLKDD